MSATTEAPHLAFRELIHGAMLVALSAVLPVVFHAVGLGAVFLPLHLPSLLAGLLLSPPIAVAVGLLAPWVSMLGTGMPPFHYAVLMSFELPVLAGTAALLVRLKVPLPLAALGAVVARMAVTLALTGLFSGYLGFRFNVGWVSVLTSWPGVVLQLVTVPPAAKTIRVYRTGVESPGNCLETNDEP